MVPQIAKTGQTNTCVLTFSPGTDGSKLHLTEPVQVASMHPGLQGVTGMDILPGLQNMPGAPGSPYPVAAYRHSHNTSNVVNNVTTASQLSDIRRQSEAAAARVRAAEGAAIDRQLAIAERNRGGRNDSQGDSV